MKPVMHPWRRVLLPAVLGLLLTGSRPAAAQTTIDFQQMETADRNWHWVPFPPGYSEQGFTLLNNMSGANAFVYWGTQYPNYAGSTGLFNNYVGGITTLTKDDHTA